MPLAAASAGQGLRLQIREGGKAMQGTQTKRTGRAGFTLVEMLVVLAIIAVIMSLLSSAAFKAFDSMYQTGNSSDIRLLEAEVGRFMAEFRVPPPPSKFTVSTTDPYIKKMFPGIDQGAGTVNWGVSGTLSGDQCLVFFLGGIPNGQGGVGGFSTNNLNPSDSNSRHPFFDFKVDRLVKTAGGNFSYKDYYKNGSNTAVYAYFSSNGIPNNYNPSDCSSLGVQPYMSAAGQYYKNDGFQIISPGKDGVFGSVPSGSFWTPTNVSVLSPTGRDDQANFYGATLGTASYAD